MTDTSTLENDILETMEIVMLQPLHGAFNPKVCFSSKNREVRISTVWAEFRKRFLGKSESGPPAVSLHKYRLKKISPDGPIIEALGGESAVETNIASIYAMIKQQAFGQPGPLQINGYANIFYARCKEGLLCAVRVGWDGEGWIIDAIPVRDPLAWNGQHQIFCPVA